MDCPFWNPTASVDAPSDDRPGVSLVSQAIESQSAAQNSVLPAEPSSPSSYGSSDSSSSSAVSPSQDFSSTYPASPSDQVPIAGTSPPPGFSPLQPTQPFSSPTDSDMIFLQANSLAFQVKDTDDHEMEQSSSKRRASSPNREFDNDVSKRKCQ